MTAVARVGIEICFAMLGLIGSGLLVLWAASPGKEISGDERWAVGTFPSPDDAWMAVVGEHAYSGSGRADTSQFEAVQLVRYVRHQGNPLDPSYVFTMEPGGDPEDRLLLQWLGPRKLQITAPNKSFIQIKKSGYEDVEVVVKYERDDPAERARYLRARGLPPD